MSFCSEIYCNSDTGSYFDIMFFKQYLFKQTEMSHSIIREYLVRLYQLDELFTKAQFFVTEVTIENSSSDSG